MTGKRKRDTSVVSRSTATEDQETAPTTTDNSSHDIFRKFFESQFQPLEVPGGPVTHGKASEEEISESESEDSEAGSEWSGVSDEEDEVEVVEHTASSTTRDELMDKKARKAFMTSKPPSLSTDSTTVMAPSTKSKTANDDDDKAIDANHLKNDLALQRLLKESHLLESASELDPTGKNRLKALDLRMQSLGAKSSLYHQKMPSSHRIGIKAKASMKEDKRRREARENGIILEKPTKSKISKGYRERGVGGPSIGKFTGGTLNLSKRDLTAMQSSRRSTKGKTRGKTRGGSRGGRR